MKDDNIHKDHRRRLRTRYTREGLDNFEDHEILELLLHYPIKYIDTNELGHKLINGIGSFAEVLDADAEELSAINGIGNREASFLKIIRALCDHYVKEKEEKVTLFKTVQSVAEYCIEQYRGIVEETYSVLLFDVADKLLGFEVLQGCSYRDIDSLGKELGRYVFGYNADSFVLVRNAVDQSITPSKAEMDACLNLAELFGSFNRLLGEYFILSDCRYMPVIKYAREHYDFLDREDRIYDRAIYFDDEDEENSLG